MKRPRLAKSLPGLSLSARRWAIYLGYLAVWEGAARMPDPLAWRLADPAGDLWYVLGSRRQRHRVRANLARVVRHADRRQADALVRAAYRSYARYWLDAFRAHRLDPDEVMARTSDEGCDRIDELLSGGRGAILATGHLGSWDIGAFFSRRRGWHLTVVAEVVEPRRLFQRFVRLRRQLGADVVPLLRGQDVLGRLERVVNDGGLATLLADRDLTGSGPVVELFGEACRLPAGPAVLARRTGRPVAVGAFFTTPRGWRAVVHEPLTIAHLDVVGGTQAVAHALEDLIREDPAQWHLFVPNWLVDREPDHPAVDGVHADRPAPTDSGGTRP